MTGIFNDPLYGRRNRIMAIVLAAIVLAIAVAAWLFTDVVIVVLVVLGLAAFLSVAFRLGFWGFVWPGSMWPVPNLWDRLREYERRDDDRP